MADPKAAGDLVGEVAAGGAGLVATRAASHLLVQGVGQALAGTGRQEGRAWVCWFTGGDGWVVMMLVVLCGTRRAAIAQVLPCGQTNLTSPPSPSPPPPPPPHPPTTFLLQSASPCGCSTPWRTGCTSSCWTAWLPRRWAPARRRRWHKELWGRHATRWWTRWRVWCRMASKRRRACRTDADTTGMHNLCAARTLSAHTHTHTIRNVPPPLPSPLPTGPPSPFKLITQRLPEWSPPGEGCARRNPPDRVPGSQRRQAIVVCAHRLSPLIPFVVNASL